MGAKGEIESFSFFVATVFYTNLANNKSLLLRLVQDLKFRLSNPPVCEMLAKIKTNTRQK